MHVSSEAVRSQSPIVEINGSVREFLIRLGVDTGGREYATFAKQMRALSACRMSLGFGTETIDAKPIERFNAWTDADGERDRHSPGVIELTPKFFASLTEFAVPLDARALAYCEQAEQSRHVLILQPSPESAVLTRQTGAPCVLGFAHDLPGRAVGNARAGGGQGRG